MGLNGRTKAYQILQSASLIITCIVCYSLLITLYLSPKSLEIKAFLSPDASSTIQPSAAVGILATIISGATSAYVTRSVEHSLWITLWDGPKQRQYPLTIGEVRRLARWSTSPWDRLLYMLGNPRHRSILLFLAGPCLLATSAVVGPVLLLGISQSEEQILVFNAWWHSSNPWEGRLTLPRGVNATEYLNLNQSSSNLSIMGDYGMEVASLSAMNNDTAQAAPNFCDGLIKDYELYNGKVSPKNCSLAARTVHIRAECTAQDLPNPEGLRVIPENGNTTAVFCSGDLRQDNVASNRLCASLGKDSTDPIATTVYSNFKTGMPQCDTRLNETECVEFMNTGGNWAYILGVWVRGSIGTAVSSDHRIQRVDCRLTYGNITVTQVGTEPPFLKETELQHYESDAVLDVKDLPEAVKSLRNLYVMPSDGDNTGSSPYAWVEVESRDPSAPKARTDARFRRSPIPAMLLGYNASNDAETVARQIELNFEMATLQAFARNRGSSDMRIEAWTGKAIYVYNPKVLWVLLVPVLATLAGSWGRWRIAGEDRTVGYDPVGIAQLGPITMAVDDPDAEDTITSPQNKRDKKKYDRLGAWLIKSESVRQGGKMSTGGSFVAGPIERSKKGYDNIYPMGKYRSLPTDSLVVVPRDGDGGGADHPKTSSVTLTVGSEARSPIGRTIGISVLGGL